MNGTSLLALVQNGLGFARAFTICQSGRRKAFAHHFLNSELVCARRSAPQTKSSRTSAALTAQLVQQGHKLGICLAKHARQHGHARADASRPRRLCLVGDRKQVFARTEPKQPKGSRGLRDCFCQHAFRNPWLHTVSNANKRSASLRATGGS